MKITDYVKASEDLRLIAAANEVGASRALIKAAEIKRHRIREQVENDPRRHENLKEDVVYKLGQLSGLNWVIDLPRKAKDHINSLPEGD